MYFHWVFSPLFPVNRRYLTVYESCSRVMFLIFCLEFWVNRGEWRRGRRSLTWARGQGVEFLMAPLSLACVSEAHRASDLSNPFSGSPLPQGPGPRPQQGLDGPIGSRPTSLSLWPLFSPVLLFPPPPISNNWYFLRSSKQPWFLPAQGFAHFVPSAWNILSDPIRLDEFSVMWPQNFLTLFFHSPWSQFWFLPKQNQHQDFGGDFSTHSKGEVQGVREGRWDK